MHINGVSKYVYCLLIYIHVSTTSRTHDETYRISRNGKMMNGQDNKSCSKDMINDQVCKSQHNVFLYAFIRTYAIILGKKTIHFFDEN